mgnify:CR=1 FL=1
MTILTILAGFALLIAGAEALVRGASRLAQAVGIPPLIIGLTVVAFGTSAPEFAVRAYPETAGDWLILRSLRSKMCLSPSPPRFWDRP